MQKKLNFNWVIPDILAASSIPSSKEDLEWLVNNQNIKMIITLTEEKLSKKIKYFESVRKELHFKYYHIPTVDGTGFYTHQFEKIVKLFNENKNRNGKMLIHCEGGYGRTSTALTALWMSHYKKNLKDAIHDLKQDNVRPQAIYTLNQLESLKKWEEFLAKKGIIK